jgi:hypothetical protein
MANFAPYKKLIDSTTGGPGKDIPDNFLSTEAPKLKFNWTVQFLDREVGINSDGNSPDMASNKFAVKTADRPKPQIDYQEINIYNFRTRVAVKTDYGTVSVTFYDDVSNRAHNIMTKYLKHVSPIASAGSGNSLDNAENNASIGPLGDRMGPFEGILLTHYYSKGNSVGKTTYKYLNPKFTTFEYDNLDMTQSEVNSLTMTFYYDSVLITEG